MFLQVVETARSEEWATLKEKYWRMLEGGRVSTMEVMDQDPSWWLEAPAARLLSPRARREMTAVVERMFGDV